MSIAVSAVVAPSRRLRLVLRGYAACCTGAALMLAGPQAARFHGAWAAAALCQAAAVAAWRAAPATTRRIDISGPGEIRLLVQHGMDAAPALQLLAPCTVWPGLMLLRLQAPGQGVTVLAILPDSVAPGQFRELAVAVRTIAGRDQSFGKCKIL